MNKDENLALMCKALGHPARVAILRHLANMDGCVCGALVGILPLAQSTVSQHLKILKQAGLIQGRIEGVRTCYCVDREVLQGLKELVEGLCGQAGPDPCPRGDCHVRD